jgi:hypothetical protein
MPQCFAARPHLSKAAVDYCSALLAYNARAAQVDRVWVRRISWGTYVYMHLVRIVDGAAKGLGNEKKKSTANRADHPAMRPAVL